jgi:hypothetical protein
MSRKPGDKCLGHFLCPQCMEETGISHVYKSRYTFAMHLPKHAEMVEEIIPQNDTPGNTHYYPEHRIIRPSTNGWWPKWAEKYMRLNKHCRMSVDFFSYAIIDNKFYKCDCNTKGCITCDNDFTKCGFHDTAIPFDSCNHWVSWVEKRQVRRHP